MRNPTTRMGLLLAGLTVLALASPALAVDGVIEINQAKALAGGVTPGDTPFFPVTLDSAGSYVLTSDLVMSSASARGIAVTASDVTIDLNGFTIRGLVTCSTPDTAQNITCTTGVSEGIRAVAPHENVAVLNGSVQGFGSRCIELLGDRARVEHVRVAHCGFDGIKTGDGALIRGTSVKLVIQVGLWLEEHGRIESSAVELSRSSGIFAGAGSVVIGTLSNANGGFGFNCRDTTLVNDVAVGNEVGGVVANDHTSVIGSMILNNGQVGITCQGTGVCNLVDNLVSNHSLRELTFLVPGGYKGNVLNGTTPVTGAGLQTGTNFCNGSVCP